MITDHTDNIANDASFSASTPWHEAGALVIRQHTDRKSWALSESVTTADPNLTTIDQGFTTFVTRFAQRRGHVAFGTVFEMAEAWGIEVEGDLALCSAHDPNCVLWPRSSQAYLDHLIYLLQADPETCSAHEIDPDDPTVTNGVISPTLKTIDVALYNAEQPQTEPRWLPAVLCGAREGLGAKASQSLGDIEGLLASVLGDGDMSSALDSLKELGISMTIGVVDAEGNVTRLAGDGNIPDNISDLGGESKTSQNGYHA